MIDHAPALCRNRLLSVLLPTEPSQLRRCPMRVQRANSLGQHDAGKCVEQRFASMAIVADKESFP